MALADFGRQFRLSGALSLFCLVCFLLTHLPPAFGNGAASEPAGDTDYTSGVAAYRAGQYLAAEQAFGQVLAREPRNVNAHYYRALVLDSLGQRGGAASEYRYVADYGREARIVAYARTRADLLQGTERFLKREPKPDAFSPDEFKPDASRSAYPKKVPLTNSRNALMLDAILYQGRQQAQASFIVDTGATYTSISQDLAEQLGLDIQRSERIRITTANGRIDVPKVVIATLNVNGLEAHNVEATVIPIRHGSSFSGLLGLSFLRQFVVTIDPQAGHLIFNKQANF